MLKITSKKDGFRRCGVEHPATPTLHEEDAFTDEQIEILKAESMLIVEEVDGDFEEKPKGKAGKLLKNDDDEKKLAEDKKAAEEKEAAEEKKLAEKK